MIRRAFGRRSPATGCRASPRRYRGRPGVTVRRACRVAGAEVLARSAPLAAGRLLPPTLPRVAARIAAALTVVGEDERAAVAAARVELAIRAELERPPPSGSGTAGSSPRSGAARGRSSSCRLACRRESRPLMTQPSPVAPGGVGAGIPTPPKAGVVVPRCGRSVEHVHVGVGREAWREGYPQHAPPRSRGRSFEVGEQVGVMSRASRTP